jgi:hypothetical protein
VVIFDEICGLNMTDRDIITCSLRILKFETFKEDRFIESSLLSASFYVEFYVLLTVHLGIILVNDRLDAQFFFLICLFQSSSCFEQPRAHHQENQLYQYNFCICHSV